MTLDMDTLQPLPDEATPPPGVYTSAELDQARAALDRRELVRAGCRLALAQLRPLLPPREGDPPGLLRVVLTLQELGA